MVPAFAYRWFCGPWRYGTELRARSGQIKTPALIRRGPLGAPVHDETDPLRLRPHFRPDGRRMGHDISATVEGISAIGCASVVADSMSPGRELDDVPLAGIAEGTPTPPLGFCNPSSTNLCLRTRRQSTVKPAARLPEFNSDHTGPACSSFGTTAWSICTPRLPPQVRDQIRISNHCNPSKTP
jgi:hypothetical protein